MGIFCLFPSAAFAEGIAVAPFSGKIGKQCTKVVRDLAASITEVQPWEEKRVPSSWKKLSAWLDERGHDVGVGVVILGSVSKNALVLEAYDLRRVKLVGLKSVAPGKACKLNAGGKQIVLTMVREALGIDGPRAPELLSVKEEPAQRQQDAHRTHPPTPQVDLTPQISSDTKVEKEKVLLEIAVENTRAEGAFKEPRPKTPKRSPVRAVVELDLGLRKEPSELVPAPGLLVRAHPLELALPLFLEARYRRAFAASYGELGARLGWRLGIDALHVAMSPAVGFHRVEAETALGREKYTSVELRVALEWAPLDMLAFEGAYSYLLELDEAYGGEASFGARYRVFRTPDLSIMLGGAVQNYRGGDATFMGRTGLRVDLD